MTADEDREEAARHVREFLQAFDAYTAEEALQRHHAPSEIVLSINGYPPQDAEISISDLRVLSQETEQNPPIRTLQELYNVLTGQVLRSGFPHASNVWFKAPGGWRRTGLAGVYSTERVAQDLPLQLLKERP